MHTRRTDELRTEIRAERRKMDVVHVRMRTVRKRMENVLKDTDAATAGVVSGLTERGGGTSD